MNKEEKAKLWADRIQQYKTSGQTCKQWCAENDIPLSTMVNNPVPVSLLSGDRKPQIRFLGNHHSGSGNLYHKSFRM